MVEVTVSKKGEVVLPKELGDQLGWTAGTRLVVSAGGDAVTVRKASDIEDRFPRISKEEFLARRLKVSTALPSDRQIKALLIAEAGRRYDAKRR